MHVIPIRYDLCYLLIDFFCCFWEPNISTSLQTSFVLCRVFVKSHGGNSLSEIGLSSVAEESVSAVRHIGVQHDGYLTPDIVKVKEHDDKPVDWKKDTSEKQMQLVSQLDNHASSRPVSLTSFQFPAGIPPSKQGTLNIFPICYNNTDFSVYVLCLIFGTKIYGFHITHMLSKGIVAFFNFRCFILDVCVKHMNHTT